MSYETYAYLKSLIEQAENKLEKEYQVSCDFIPIEAPKRGQQTGRDKAHKIFSDAWAKLRNMREELHDAAACTYKDHPNPEMRKFWGLKT